MEDENDTVTRARLAEVWKVSLPTIDDWVRRGCPIHKEGDKGKACEFSLIAVKKWRVRDLAIRSGADVTELDRKGLEHGNGLRGLVQHAPEHFLRYAFRVGTHVFKEDLEELGLNDRQAKLGTLGIFLVLSYIYEQWLASDAFNEQVKHDLHEDLDSVFRLMGSSWFKGQSLPPINCSVGEKELPEPLIEYCEELHREKALPAQRARRGSAELRQGFDAGFNQRNV